MWNFVKRAGSIGLSSNNVVSSRTASVSVGDKSKKQEVMNIIESF